MKKKVTQEELANYIGVSKAAVSKWESGTSYPDITCLPQLATYFNLSIDELMGYEPQLTKAEIKSIYQELKTLFAEKTFQEAFEKCQELEKKYFSCFPFLLQLAVFYMNHASLSENPTKIINHAIELTERVRFMSEDVNDAKEATSMEAVMWLLVGEPMNAMDLLDQSLPPMSQDTEILGQTYQAIGNTSKAKETFQVAIYQHLISLLADTTTYMNLHLDDLGVAEECIRRGESLIDNFNIVKLHPNTAAVFYLTSAQVYIVNKKDEHALEYLQKYMHVCLHEFLPFTLHGDEFFDQIELWFQDFYLGNAAPRSQKLIQESMVQGIKANPIFESLRKYSKYQHIVEQLESKNTSN